MNTIQGTTKFSEAEKQKRKKSKGIVGRSSDDTIIKRQSIIRHILSNDNNKDMNKESFLSEFKQQCKRNNIEIPSEATIQSDLLKLGYKLKKGKYLHKNPQLDLALAETIQKYFVKSVLNRISIRIKSDEYLFIPLLVEHNGSNNVNAEDYYTNIRNTIQNDYNSLCSIEIFIFVENNGYESILAQLFMDALQDNLLACSVNVKSIVLLCTVELVDNILDFLYESLPNTMPTIEHDNINQPL